MHASNNPLKNNILVKFNFIFFIFKTNKRSKLLRTRTHILISFPINPLKLLLNRVYAMLSYLVYL